MTDEHANSKPDITDASDLADLYCDPALGDGLTDTVLLDIPIGKPRAFFRVHPDKSYRRVVEVYTHKPEGQIEEEHFFIAKSMRGMIEEARLATLVTCIYRDGSVRLWPLKRPKSDEKDNKAWESARGAAREATTKWGRLVMGVGWDRGADRASNDADVSSTLPIIPYGGFSPVRLEGWLSKRCLPGSSAA